jgi:hypothetical protein
VEPTVRSLLVLVILVVAGLLPLATPAQAQTIGDLIGSWDMVHDDWRGTLVVNPSPQRLVEVDGACTYATWRIDGTYTGSDGARRFFRGYFQGRDTNWRPGGGCRTSSHVVRFAIPFDPRAPQAFEGYLFTHQKRAMAGYTWWQGIPFGWYAVKR